ncbi:MAG: TetR/AcrR family transcriptional regulator [Acidobacteria bacterium]|nr:TetR/AcrR family transcriptional regulator [Acidobacteriota bacterium]
MGIAERREREKHNLRQEILDAASELFAREGYANVSMRKIAEQIEYSPTTIYLYFKDKTDLLKQICEETFGKLIETVAAIERAGVGEPLDCLRKGMRAYIDFGLRHPYHYEVTLITPLAGAINQEDYPYEGSAGQQAFEYIVRQVGRGMELGQFRPGDVATVSQAIWAAIHGVTALMISHPDFPFVDREALIEQVVEMTIKGLQS